MAVKIPGYQLLTPVAEGGMASVYLAMQSSLQRKVALKVLKKFDCKSQSQRFLSEGHIIASLNHRNIITIHDIGVHCDQHFIAMAYLEGGDLEARIAGGLELEESLEILDTMGCCLKYVHEQGIVHRDVKPANILFQNDGSPVLTDFGIAKNQQQDIRLTLDGTAVGSPHYLSPEQAQGHSVDGRTDLYALGIVFYEMLTGRKPFTGETPMEIILAHLTQAVPQFPPEYRYLQSLLDRMLAKEPGGRFDNTADMVEQLRALRQLKSEFPQETGQETERIAGNTAKPAQHARGKRYWLPASVPLRYIRIPLLPAWRKIASVKSTDSGHSHLGWAHIFNPSSRELEPHIDFLLEAERALKENRLVPAGVG